MLQFLRITARTMQPFIRRGSPEPSFSSAARRAAGRAAGHRPALHRPASSASERDRPDALEDAAGVIGRRAAPRDLAGPSMRDHHQRARPPPRIRSPRSRHRRIASTNPASPSSAPTLEDRDRRIGLAADRDGHPTRLSVQGADRLPDAVDVTEPRRRAGGGLDGGRIGREVHSIRLVGRDREPSRHRPCANATSARISSTEEIAWISVMSATSRRAAASSWSTSSPAEALDLGEAHLGRQVVRALGSLLDLARRPVPVADADRQLRRRC